MKVKVTIQKDNGESQVYELEDVNRVKETLIGKNELQIRIFKDKIAAEFGVE